jgi:translocation and assembly module TamB
MNIKFRVFEVTHGVIRTDLQTIGVELRSRDTRIGMTYDRRTATYSARVQSPSVHMVSTLSSAVTASIDARFHLERNRLVLESSRIVSGASMLEASGAIRNFDRPVLDAQVNAKVTAQEVALLAGFPGLHSGRFIVQGAVHRETHHPFEFAGKLAGDELAWRSKDFSLDRCSFSSQVIAAPERVELTDLDLRLPLGNFRGDAILLQHTFSVQGRVTTQRATELLKILTGRDLGVQSLLSGSLALRAELFHSGESLRTGDLTAESKLDFHAIPFGIPMSGHTDVTYRRVDRSVSLSNSYVDLPHTHITVDGVANRRLTFVAESTNLDDLRPFVTAKLPQLLPGGNTRLDGVINDPLARQTVDANLTVNHFSAMGQNWAHLRAHVLLSPDSAVLTGLDAAAASSEVSGNMRLALNNWSLTTNAPATIHLRFRSVPLERFYAVSSLNDLHLSGGSMSGTADLQGPLTALTGNTHLITRKVQIYGQTIEDASADVQLLPGELRVSNGAAVSGSARLKFSGAFTHPRASWQDGQVEIKADTNGFPLASIALAHNREPAWNADLELHLDAALRITKGRVEPSVANGTVLLRRVREQHQQLGNATLNFSTQAGTLYTGFSGDLGQTHLKGNAEVSLVAGSPFKGDLTFDRATIATVYSLVIAAPAQQLPMNGAFNGTAKFDGLLSQPERVHASVRLDSVQLNAAQLPEHAPAPAMIFRNAGPVVLNAANGRVSITDCDLTGPDTNLSLTGSVAYLGHPSLALRAQGNVDLRIFQLFQPGVQVSGRSLVSAEITGTLTAPQIDGKLEVQNGTLIASGFVNELTRVNGIIQFSRDRATIQKLTAETGGGTLSVGGFVEFTNAGQLTYRLEGDADNVRFRYANSISVSGNANLRLAGTSRNSVLSGTATVSRVVFTPNADVGTLLGSAFAPSAAETKESDFLTGLQLDVRVESAPDLQVTTQLSRDLQAEIDLRLRGTLDHPILLGDIEANQGDIRIFGAKYSINRGEVRFVNAARIVPVVDLDLQTVARGITVDVTIAGTPGKLNINYRSDPPLQPRDILALLTVGRVPDTGAANPNVQTTTDTSALQYGANSVIGQAISPVSNRLSKLFGITNVKIDPFVQGITYAPQARLTLEQQISREIVVTYVTNLSQTSEQIFRIEWAFSPQYSLVALRDDNGEFGIDIQYRKRFK